jgi:hypothetical protein
MRSRAVEADEAEADRPHGALLGVALALGVLLFIIFFLLGYLGPLLLGGR